MKGQRKWTTQEVTKLIGRFVKGAKLGEDVSTATQRAADIIGVSFASASGKLRRHAKWKEWSALFEPVVTSTGPQEEETPDTLTIRRLEQKVQLLSDQATRLKKNLRNEDRESGVVL